MRHPSDFLLAVFPSDCLYSHTYIHATCSVPPVLLYIVYADNVCCILHVMELLVTEFLSCFATSPALRTQTPTIQTARLCRIIICILREKSEKCVYYFTKNDLKNSKRFNFGALYVEMLRFVSRLRAGCDPRVRTSSTPLSKWTSCGIVTDSGTFNCEKIKSWRNIVQEETDARVT